MSTSTSFVDNDYKNNQWVDRVRVAVYGKTNGKISKVKDSEFKI